jgi:O-antigen ligase
MSFHRYIFYSLIILLPTQLGFHYWPDWSMVLGRRLDYLSPTFFLTDLLIVALCCSWFVESWPYKKNLLRREILLPIVALSIFIVCNSLFAISRPLALSAWIKWIEIGLVGFYIIRTKPTVENMVPYFSIALLYSSLLAIVQFILQHSLGGPLWWLGERTFTEATPGLAKISLCLPLLTGCPLFIRSYATFPHPNVLGGFLAVMLPLIFVYQTKRISRVTMTSIIVSIVALILTFSRSAWIIAALGIVSVYGKNKKLVSPSWGIGITSIVFLIVILMPSFTLESESVAVRQQLNTAALNVWASAPIVGVGMGNFLLALPSYLPSRAIYFLQPVHNIYLLLLSEIGIVGISLLLWICGRLLYLAKKRQYRWNNIYSIPLLGLLLLGLVDHYALTLQQGKLLLVILVACFINQWMLPSSHHDSQT